MSVSEIWRSSSPTGSFEFSQPELESSHCLRVEIAHSRDDGSIVYEHLHFRGVYAYMCRMFEVISPTEVRDVYNAVVDKGHSEWAVEISRAIRASALVNKTNPALRHMQVSFDNYETSGTFYDIACECFEASIVHTKPPEQSL